MEPRLQPAFTKDQLVLDRAGGGVVVADTHRVLRNTYWLLALSMLPTIAGAFVGMQINLTALYVSNPILTPLLMIAILFGALFGVSALRNSVWGVPALFAFTFIAGATLAPNLTAALGLRNGGQLIALAAGMTAAIFFAMAGIATVSKRDFSFLGKFLFVGLILLLVAMVANLFLQIPAMTLTVSVIAVGLFSMWILHDVSRIVHGGETNYIMATLGIFLDLLNLFVNLLNILMILSGQRD
jgi:modulator of FtsH protease